MLQSRRYFVKEKESCVLTLFLETLILRKTLFFDFSPDAAAITITLPKGKSDDEWSSSSLYIVEVEGTESAE